MRMVLDTNVLIDSASDELSAPAKLLAAACAGKFVALITPAIRSEYRMLTRRLTSNAAFAARVEAFIAASEVVAEEHVEVTLDDPEDYKFLRAAVGGTADLVVTNDRHLLDVGEIADVRIVTPTEAWTAFREASEDTSEWQAWAQGLGLGGS